MHDSIRQTEPSLLWTAFVDLNAVPRGSKQEAAVTAFVAKRGIELGLDTQVDSIGNILIRKPGTKGYEGHAPVVLQSHIDMVWQKNAGTAFDFETQGIQMQIDGDWVKANGTTLGADNGIGVATIFSVLASSSIEHPPLECIFTVDEETGMTGAKELDPTWLKGRILLNLDTEQDNELTIGCAGGADVTSISRYVTESVSAEYQAMKIRVRGLTGGHSGMEIHLGRGNANKIMNRILFEAADRFGLRLSSLEGGSLRNAIPRESVALVFLPKDQIAAFEGWLKQAANTVNLENTVTDPNLVISAEPAIPSTHVALLKVTQQALFAAVDGTLSGIYRMSPSIAGLVQTSNNLARVVVADGTISILCLSRSSIDSERDSLTSSLRSVMSVLGGDVEVSGEYPGWQPAPQSKIVSLMRRLYTEMFGDEPHVAACHAGLECGIIGSKYPGMEMISFGPNILGAHSPDERVQVSSVQKFYRYFTKVLASL